MELFEYLDPETRRQHYLKELQERVHFAFINRRQDPGLLIEKEEISKQKEFLKNPDKLSRPGPYVEDAHIVSVTDPSDYPVLLRMALNKFGLSEEAIEKQVEKSLEHAYSKASVFKDRPDLTVRYGVAFVETEKGIGLQPGTFITGEVDPELIRQAAFAPKNPSRFDTSHFS